MAEGKGRKRSTAGEEGQIIPLNEVEVVNTETGEVMSVDADFGAQESWDEESQGGGFDAMQETYDEESQAVAMDESQLRRGKG